MNNLVILAGNPERFAAAMARAEEEAAWLHLISSVTALGRDPSLLGEYEAELERRWEFARQLATGTPDARPDRAGLIRSMATEIRGGLL